MRYFYIAFAIACLLVVVIAGPQGRHSVNRPFEFFPDMVRQHKVKAQSNSGFFADGIGPRRPVEGAVPIGFEHPQAEQVKQVNVAPVSGADHPGPGHPTIGNRPNGRYTAAPEYFDTGKMADQWGTGIPFEVTPEVMARGQDRFLINCSVCHGATGGGNGVTSKYGWPNIANNHDKRIVEMADGEIFNTISNGKNSMMGYGANISLEDRWAIVAYIRALQRAQNAKLDDVQDPTERARLAADLQKK